MLFYEKTILLGIEELLEVFYFLFQLHMNLFKTTRGGKFLTLIEMLVVLILIGGLLAFFINRISNNSWPENESNIPMHLKTYASTMLKTFNEDISSIKPITFKKLFIDADVQTNKQGFQKTISQCHIEPSEFTTLQDTFATNFKIASVGESQATIYPTKVVESVRSILTKLGAWRMYFVGAAKKDMLNNASKQYKSIADYIYVVVIEHSKANLGEFKSSAIATDGDEHYYNAVILDSNLNIYDGVSDKFLVRSILGKTTGAANESFNELIEFDQKVIDKIKSVNSVGCLQ